VLDLREHDPRGRAEPLTSHDATLRQGARFQEKGDAEEGGGDHAREGCR